MTIKPFATVFAAGLMSFAYLAAPAAADEWNKRTTFQFDQPVEVPGHVLNAGDTYVFQLLNSSSNRNIVQIFSEDKNGLDHLVATEEVAPAYRVNTPDRPMVTLEERPSYNPEAISSWFYPGDDTGWHFLYPGVRGLNHAKATPAQTAPAAAGQ